MLPEVLKAGTKKSFIKISASSLIEALPYPLDFYALPGKIDIRKSLLLQPVNAAMAKLVDALP